MNLTMRSGVLVYYLQDITGKDFSKRQMKEISKLRFTFTKIRKSQTFFDP